MGLRTMFPRTGRKMTSYTSGLVNRAHHGWRFCNDLDLPSTLLVANDPDRWQAKQRQARVFHLGHFLLAALQGTLCPSSGLEMEA
jgi:hypothetical protein